MCIAAVLPGCGCCPSGIQYILPLDWVAVLFAIGLGRCAAKLNKAAKKTLETGSPDNLSSFIALSPHLQYCLEDFAKRELNPVHTCLCLIKFKKILKSLPSFNGQIIPSVSPSCKPSEPHMWDNGQKVVLCAALRRMDAYFRQARYGDVTAKQLCLLLKT